MPNNVLRWFENDGGPLLILPREALACWEGSKSPSSGRHVEAAFRADTGSAATDYDRACDVTDAAAILDVGASWAMVISEPAPSVAWLTGTASRECVAVNFDYGDDSGLGSLLDAYTRVSADEWRRLGTGVTIGSQELLLMHAASSDEVRIGSSRTDGNAIIGEALPIAVVEGRYVVQVATVETVDTGLVFYRFQWT